MLRWPVSEIGSKVSPGEEIAPSDRRGASSAREAVGLQRGCRYRWNRSAASLACSRSRGQSGLVDARRDAVVEAAYAPENHYEYGWTALERHDSLDHQPIAIFPLSEASQRISGIGTGVK